MSRELPTNMEIMVMESLYGHPPTRTFVAANRHPEIAREAFYVYVRDLVRKGFLKHSKDQAQNKAYIVLTEKGSAFVKYWWKWHQ